MKRKLLAGVLAVACMALTVLGGCGNVKTDSEAAMESSSETGDKAEAEEAAPATTKNPYEEDVKIAFIPYTIGDSVGSAWAEGMKAEFANYSTVTFNVFDGEASVDTEVQIIDDLINQSYDAIILQSVDSAGLAASVQKAEAAGIPVITVNLDADTPHSSLVAMVDYEGGAQVAQSIAESLGGKGNVVIIQASPGATKGENSSRGFKDALEAYPDIEILDEQTGEWLTEEAYTVMADFLTKYPEIDAVFCHNDAMAEGAAEAAKAVGRLDDIQIWGMDGETKMLEYIEQGLCTGTIYTNCQEQGATCARMAMYHIAAGVRSNASTPVVKIAPIVVTSENVSDITDDMRW
ncbi:MAG: sugar ABC transporter substrate-binding protein [Lachnospiraceae bacterium]|nr:sugar ABC transporter substrate-binding protein [Lachnospiraceae bacterium]